jgi:hypothetical protein
MNLIAHLCKNGRECSEVFKMHMSQHNGPGHNGPSVNDSISSPPADDAAANDMPVRRVFKLYERAFAASPLVSLPEIALANSIAGKKNGSRTLQKRKLVHYNRKWEWVMAENPIRRFDE